MNLSSLKNMPGAKTTRKRVGRGEGSGLGKTCGRGQKGQMSRSGHKRKRGFEGGQMRLIRRIPKRGFTNPCREETVPVNLVSLAGFADGATVDTAALLAAGVVRRAGRIKILGDGDVGKKLTVKAHAFSASAKAKIEAAGGVCEIVTG